MRVSSLTVTVPETADRDQLEREIVTSLADRLRDDHGYRLLAEATAGALDSRREYPMVPHSKIVINRKPGALKVKLQGVNVDARDLFTGVSSELELRHEGLRTEIG